MVRSELFEVWTEQERKTGRRITIDEVAKATGLDPKTVGALRRGETTRFDAHVLARLCEYFGIGDGEPVPFLKVYHTEPA